MIKKTVQKLHKIGFKDDNVEQVALWLLQKITGKTGAELLVGEEILPHEEEKYLDRLIYDLVIKKKPLQYILETVPFCDMELFIEVPVLVPRPETEEWVYELIKRYSDISSLKILDLCTGSGCIALACAKHFSGSVVTGIDISHEATVLAEKNKQQLKFENVIFLQSDLFNAVNDQFDIIVANPPYISEEEWIDLESQVKDWEEKKALVAENRGFALIERIIKDSPVHFKRNSEALLVIEIGCSQAEMVCTLMKSCGYTNVEVLKDFSGHDRVVMGRYVAEKS